MDKAKFEAMILDAISEAGNLHTLGAENGVEIDGSGPQEGSVIPVEGYYREANGKKSYFLASITVELEEFSTVWEDDDDEEWEED